MKYDRTIDGKFESLLARGGPLHDLMVDPGAICCPGDVPTIPLDVQLRRGEEVHIYAGLTRILSLSWKEGAVSATAHDTYQKQASGAGLFRPYPTADVLALRGLTSSWWTYLAGLQVDDRWLGREGRWQAWLSDRYGRRYGAGDPFCVVDAQAVIEFDRSGPNKDGIVQPLQDALAATRARICKDPVVASISPKLAAANPFREKKDGDELDLLAVTPQRDLALVEVKPGDVAAGVYSSPLQIGMYMLLWQRFCAGGKKPVAEVINALIAQKKRIGLLPDHAPTLRDDFAILPVLAVGDPKATSDSWPLLRRIWHVVAHDHPGILEDLCLLAFELERADVRQTTVPQALRTGLPWI